jgi:hypothetical protein
MSACHNELRHELWQIRVPATLKGTTVSTGRSVHRTDFLVNLGTCAPPPLFGAAEELGPSLETSRRGKDVPVGHLARLGGPEA